MEEHSGKLLHTAAWDGEYDLKGKIDAVIGGGSSAVQVIPKIQPGSRSLSVFNLCYTADIADALSRWKTHPILTLLRVDHHWIRCETCRPRRHEF